MSNERKLAKVAMIDEIKTHPNADLLELAILGGWPCVVKKDESTAGDKVAYFEVDSWIPTDIAPFLSKGREPSVYENVKGERLRTVKLRGELSQGLIIPLSEGLDVLEVDTDLTEKFGVLKWEKALDVRLSGEVKGLFPSLIPKTNQERCQNLKRILEEVAETNETFEVSEKLDGTSCTFYLSREGEFEVCSRNLSLKEGDNAYWQIAKSLEIEQLMRDNDMFGCAIQGEIIGPKIQANGYKLDSMKFFVFDIFYCVQYLLPHEAMRTTKALGLDYVPTLELESRVPKTIQGILDHAEGSSILNNSVQREGFVWKSNSRDFSFKAISNKWLLKNE